MADSDAQRVAMAQPRQHTEHNMQCAVVRACQLMERKYPELKYLFAIPNGGARHRAVAAKLKAEGVKAGVPDLCLPLPIPGGPAGLWIEMKAPKGSVSDVQKNFIKYLDCVGYRTAVCYSTQSALDEILAYMKLANDLVLLRKQAD